MHTERFTDEPGQTLFAFPAGADPNEWADLVRPCDVVYAGLYSVTVDASVYKDWLVFDTALLPASFGDAIGGFTVPASLQVIPAIATSPDDCCEEPNHVNFFLDVQKLVTHGVYETDGVTPVDLSGMNLIVCVANSQGATIDEVVPTLVSSNTIQWLPPEIVTKKEDLYSWSLRDADDGDAVVAFGNLNVQYAARRVS